MAMVPRDQTKINLYRIREARAHMGIRSSSEFAATIAIAVDSKAEFKKRKWCQSSGQGKTGSMNHLSLLIDSGLENNIAILMASAPSWFRAQFNSASGYIEMPTNVLLGESCSADYPRKRRVWWKLCHQFSNVVTGENDMKCPQRAEALQRRWAWDDSHNQARVPTSIPPTDSGDFF
jgi:hypothetical protein